MSDLVVFHLYLTETFLASAVTVLLGINTITHAHRRVCNTTEKTPPAFCPGTVRTGNETKCGRAEGQVNETATESLAVFDLPPLIQRDHLIN